jgi:hypothetical protein
LPPVDAYNHGVFVYVTALLSAFERMEEAETYLVNFPHKKALKEKGITENKWIAYHYSNHLVSLTGTFDTALLLTNHVFRLGLEPTDCKESTVTKNGWVRHTPVGPALKTFFKAVDPHKAVRNRFVHRGEVPLIKAIDELEVFTVVSGRGQFADPQFLLLLRRAYSDAAKEVAADLATWRGEVVAATSKLFDALLPTYNKHTKNLFR